MKRIISVLLVVLSLATLISMAIVNTSASSAYKTYTYSIDGEALYSPDAYSADNAYTYTKMGLDKNLKSPRDLETDKEGNVYIADSGNNRVLVLNRYYEYQTSLTTFINSNGTNDSLLNPSGVFVTDTSIWVCDTDHSRLVEFDKNTYGFLRIIDAPESQLLDENAVYTPVAMAIDQYGRIYVVSTTTKEGVIVMDANGDFVGFIGAQAVTISAWEILWRNFQTDEQKKITATKSSVAYNNIAITEDGFIYATTSAIKEGSVQGAISSKSKDGKYMPVKLLNPAGDEIMRRNGFWPPAGEIDIFNTAAALSGEDIPTGPSTIIDVACGPEKTWTIADSKRKKLYTYDFNGNLLFAFGDQGKMLGSIAGISAVTYQDDRLLVMDAAANCLIVYERTEYGDMLIEAIAAENSLDYTYAIECWKKILQRNNNFDAAYVGIGNALYRSAKYEEALSYYESAYDTENWSESYKMVRKEWMSDWILVMLAIIIVLIVLIGKFFGFAAKVNKRVATDGRAKKTYWQTLLYGFYVIFHPFDGYYDLKHERRGSIGAGITFVALTIVAFFYQSIGQGYVLNPTGHTTTIFMQAISVLVPLMLFIVANWCLTTLFEGEGSFKDVFIASSYSLLPLPLLIIPATIVSNWVTITEAGLVSMFTTIAVIWMVLLIFFGTMVTHDYSIFKNLITIIGTIVGMAFIVFIVLLFSMLLSKLVGLVTNIITEIQYRI